MAMKPSYLRIAFLGMILLTSSALAEDPPPCGECTGDFKIGGNLEVPGHIKTGGELSIGGPVRADGFVGPKLSVKEAYVEDSIDAREGIFESLSVEGDMNIGDELGADKAVFNFVSISKLLDAADGTFDDLTVRNKLDASEISVSRDLEVRGSFGITRDNVLEVDLHGGHDYRTLQEAINAIPDSGSGIPTAYNTYLILVYPGIYELDRTLVINVPYTTIQGISPYTVTLQPAESISKPDKVQPLTLIQVEGHASHSGLVNLTIDVDPDVEGAKYEWAGSILKFKGSDSKKWHFDGFHIDNCTFLGPHDWEDKRDEGSMTIGGQEIDATYKVNPLLYAYTDNPILMDVIDLRNSTFHVRSDSDALRMEGSVGALVKDSYFHGYASSNLNKYHGYRGSMIRLNPMSTSECRLTLYKSLFTAHGRGRMLFFQSGNKDTASAVIYSTDIYGFQENFGRDPGATANLLTYGT